MADSMQILYLSQTLPYGPLSKQTHPLPQVSLELQKQGYFPKQSTTWSTQGLCTPCMYSRLPSPTHRTSYIQYGVSSGALLWVKPQGACPHILVGPGVFSWCKDESYFRSPQTHPPLADRVAPAPEMQWRGVKKERACVQGATCSTVLMFMEEVVRVLSLWGRCVLWPGAPAAPSGSRCSPSWSGYQDSDLRVTVKMKSQDPYCVSSMKSAVACAS